MITQIPAPRVPMLDSRTGMVSREWYLYLLSVYEDIELGSSFANKITTVTAHYSVDNNIEYIMASGTLTITLQPFQDREAILSVTNVGTGVVTIKAADGEVIREDQLLELDFQWSSVQLCPKTGGYAII